MNPRAQDTYTQAYNKWVLDRSPENMAGLVSAFMPTINAEIQQYPGSKELLRSRAKAYVVDAVNKFDPTGKTSLNSWVVTNLRQLSRYGKRLRPVRASEDMIRNAAELNKTTKELEDELGRMPTDDELQDSTGWSKKMIEKIRKSSPAAVTSAAYETTGDGGEPDAPAITSMDEIPYAQDAAYASLNARDKAIFDYKLGLHGKQQLSGADIAKKLKVTPAFVSQRSSSIGELVADLARRSY